MNPSPEIYPHSYDLVADMVYVVRLSEAEYRNASFLDQRALAPGKAGEWTPWPELRRLAGPGSAQGCDFIFHISHVGSTLLSRLLGEHRANFALREPVPLRVLAAAEIDLQAPESPISPERFEQRLEELVGYWARVWRPGQKAMVKGTSIACALAERLLDRAPDARAILMFAEPEPFLASIFGARNSIHDLRAQAQLRLRRLHRRLGETPFRLWSLSPGELTAMSWAAEMTALADAASGREPRTLRIDFERFLDAPEAGLTRAFDFLGAAISPAEAEALARSPMMTRYSKAPEHEYDAALRREVLDLGRATHGQEIRKGLAWLDAAAKAHPAVARAVELASAPA